MRALCLTTLAHPPRRSREEGLVVAIDPETLQVHVDQCMMRAAQ
jgi:hypothetical protein